jgi:hypothetical protein
MPALLHVVSQSQLPLEVMGPSDAQVSSRVLHVLSRLVAACR